MPLYNDIVALLRGPVGNNLQNHPDDIRAAKQLFAAEGRYKRPVDENKYIDQDLVDSITGFQRDNNLKVDGYMNPGGETEAMHISKRLKLPESKVEKANVITLGRAAIPLFAVLGSVLGMQNQDETEEWWKNRSTDDREDIVKGLERRQSGRISKEEEARCEEIYRRLREKCNRVKEKYGEEKAAICWQQASEVYAACLAGKSPLPPFHY